MGVYFIAAGRASNRDKTLDKACKTENLRHFLPMADFEKLDFHFPTGHGVYAWGTDNRGFKQLEQIRTGEYVVDVINETVVQIFTFCFFSDIKREEGGIQDHFEWDEERDYQYVYFLKSPKKVISSKRQGKKSYFQHAFGFTNTSWLNEQKYFIDDKVNEAIQKKSSESVEELLGIELDNMQPKKAIPEEIIDESKLQHLIWQAFGSPRANPVAEEVYQLKELDKIPFQEIKINAWERDTIRREMCIKKYGMSCYVCNFNFEEKYGVLGKDYIHIHHLKPIADLDEDYMVEVDDFRPVCSNCHSMIHRNIPPFRIDEVKLAIKNKDDLAKHKYFNFSENSYGKYLNQKVERIREEDNVLYSETFDRQVMTRYIESMELVGLSDDGRLYIDRQEKVIGMFIDEDDSDFVGMIIEVSDVLAMLKEMNDNKKVGLELDPIIADEIRKTS